ncbi:unnamed protein product [Rhizoctonia solani]|uniref:Fungal-type protein kinase domain-containing protein n=1 Tax=Rhizoctonia solani TaxID=456999 RepID=A0A8H3AXP0_9AGAM|nr:unnamed protein product [Rhizoctonia solani]
MGDSPTRARHTHSSEYRSTYVAGSRITLIRDIPEIPEVYLDSLMIGVLRNFPSEQMDSVYQALIDGGHMVDTHTNNPRWRCLPLNPSKAKKPEGEVFRFFEEIARVIIASHGTESRRNVVLKVTGHMTPLGHRHNTSRPDGFFHFKREGSLSEQVQWADIIMPMEFKNRNIYENRVDDYAKMMWSMHHVMRNDARRRYVHGLTCEDTKARLWYNDRSDIVASEEFDVNKDWKHLVRIILSILLSSPFDLGYDPTVEAVPSSAATSEAMYNITVWNNDTGIPTVYRTIRIISDAGTDSMVGRGTRVWEVRQLLGGDLVGPSYALKDVWVHADRIAEHVIVKEIREEQPEYAQHFLTPHDYGFVPLDPSTPAISDNTHKTLGRPRDLRPTHRTLRIPAPGSSIRTTSSNSQTTSNTPRDSVGHAQDIPQSPQEGHRLGTHLSKHPLLHYRMVFEEIGTPVHELRDFTSVFTAIHGGWKGLHAIHLSKRVHRDVSSGNILLVPPSTPKNLGSRGVIMDLEYAKKIDASIGAHDVKTGTVAFMATEVAAMEHHRLRMPRRSNQPIQSLNALRSFVESRNKVNTKHTRLPPFRYNPLHDMESIWWLCLWMTFYLVPTSSQGAKEQLKAYHSIFLSPDSKRVFLCEESGSRTHRLASYLLEGQSFDSIMETWAITLNTLYEMAYDKHRDSQDLLKTIQINEEITSASYQYGEEFLQSLVKESESIPTCVTLAERCEDNASTSENGKPDPSVLKCVLMRPVVSVRFNPRID